MDEQKQALFRIAMSGQLWLVVASSEKEADRIVQTWLFSRKVYYAV